MVLEVDVPAMLRRRRGPIPPIVAVSGLDTKDWRGTPGQQRILELGEWAAFAKPSSASMNRSRGKRRPDFKGNFDGLPMEIDGEYLGTPAETGNPIRRRYNMFPQSRLERLRAAPCCWFRPRYAGQMLEELTNWLVG